MEAELKSVTEAIAKIEEAFGDLDKALGDYNHERATLRERFDFNHAWGGLWAVIEEWNYWIPQTSAAHADLPASRDSS